MVSDEFAACLERLKQKAMRRPYWIDRLEQSEPKPFSPQTIQLSLSQCNVVFTPPEELQIVKILPRSYFKLIQENRPDHVFEFNYELNGFYLQLLTELNLAVALIEIENEPWELYLKPSTSPQEDVLFGYLIKPGEMAKWSQTTVDNLILNRKLPLVLDIDDTILRKSYNNKEHLVSDRQMLIDGENYILAEGLLEFLEWASQYYEISICSLGKQHYVDAVVKAIDPKHFLIKGVKYSARQKFERNYRLNNGLAAKDLVDIYAFCENDSSMPLIIDDRHTVWLAEHQDNIILVGETMDAHVWNVDFKPIMEALLFVHQQYFLNPKVKVVDVYKHYLRGCFRDRITGKQ